VVSDDPVDQQRRNGDEAHVKVLDVEGKWPVGCGYDAEARGNVGPRLLDREIERVPSERHARAAKMLELREKGLQVCGRDVGTLEPESTGIEQIDTAFGLEAERVDEDVLRHEADVSQPQCRGVTAGQITD